MNDFTDTENGDVESFELDNNLYWNNGQPIPKEAADSINYDNDLHGKIGNPQLGAQNSERQQMTDLTLLTRAQMW
jgi:hypothetical protein